MIKSPHNFRPHVGRYKSHSGFSLVELLTVVAVIAIMAVATVPALRGALDGITVASSADQVGAELAFARQAAISRNLPVEVRFYNLAGDRGEGWRGMASVIPASASGAVQDEWVGRPTTLAGATIFDNSSFSSLLEAASAERVSPRRGTQNGSAPQNLQNRPYVAFQFNPNGSTNLPRDQAWNITLRNENSRPASGAPAENFVSIVIDSMTGQFMVYQP
jgi:uncharacterized protein (TIGR02596 family)